MMCKICAFLFFTCFIFFSEAQAQREQIGVRIEHFGETSFSSPSPQPLLNSSQFSATQFHLNANIQTIVGEEGETVFYHGFQYRFLSINNKDVFLHTVYPIPPFVRVFPPKAYPDQEFHLLFYDFFIFHTLSNEYTLIVSLRPGLFSDFKNLTTDHFRLEAAAIVDKQMGASLTLGIGVARSSNFGRVLILPVLHGLYVGGSTFMVDVLLPARAELWFYPSKQIELGLTFTLAGSQYRIGETTEWSANQFGFANGVIATAIRYNLFSKLYLSGEVGYTLLRRMELVNSDLSGNDRFIQQFNPKNTGVLKLSIQLMY